MTIKRKGQKWMLISAVLLSITAFGFSRVNLVDYKSINQKLLQRNIHYNYNLELPETDCYENLFIHSLIENIYIVGKKTQQANTEPEIVIDNEKIPIDKLHVKIVDWKSRRNEHEIPLMVYRLNIHKSIKMGFINQLKNELAKSGVSRIAYAVVPTNCEYDQRYYQNLSFSMILPNWYAEWFNVKDIYKELNKTPNIIEIQQEECDYLINDTLVKSNRIKDTIKRLIQQNPDYIIKYHVNDEVVFSDYFKILASAKESVLELRNEYSEKIYSKHYDLLDNEEAFKVREIFPFCFFELTSDIKKRVGIEYNLN